MKKSILLFTATITFISLTAFGFISFNNSSKKIQSVSTIKKASIDSVKTIQKTNNRIFSDFIYDIGPRFEAITKEDLNKVTSFSDFIGKKHADRIISYKSLSIIILEGDEQTENRETGASEDFNKAQLKLLQSANNSTNILIWADYIETNIDTKQIESNHWTPHLTVVPHKQTTYSLGNKVLKKHLKEETKSVRANVNPEKLQPAKLYFTVSKNGSIKNVKLDRTSKYTAVDNKMIELIKNLPGTWEPAKNIKGEKVDQELVVSFGLMGC